MRYLYKIFKKILINYENSDIFVARCRVLWSLIFEMKISNGIILRWNAFSHIYTYTKHFEILSTRIYAFFFIRFYITRVIFSRFFICINTTCFIYVKARQKWIISGWWKFHVCISMRHVSDIWPQRPRKRRQRHLKSNIETREPLMVLPLYPISRRGIDFRVPRARRACTYVYARTTLL